MFHIIVDKLRSHDSTLNEIEIGTHKSNELELLCALLRANETVQSLTLWSNPIGYEGAKAIAEMLKQNKTLRTLDLRWNDIGDEGAKVIAEMLKQNKTLQSLDLRGNYIGVEGAKAIAEMLKQNKTLRLLRLSSNDIGDQGAKAIAEILKQNKTLHILGLRSNRIGNQFLLKVISSILQRNLALKLKVVDKNIQRIFIGLHAAFGNDVYTNLLLVDSLPHYVLLDRARKVAILQSFINKLRS